MHAAGALFPTYRCAPDGSELTLATAVLAPFRLTGLLGPLLRRSGDANIVTVSSGGMYTERFDLGRLEMPADAYRGTTAYARAKRAQVVLSHEWARRWGADGVASYAAHPGWVDTPGLASGLPSFAKLGPLLRTRLRERTRWSWLAAGEARRHDPAPPLTEGFFHDRHRRGEHHLPWTARDRDSRRTAGCSGSGVRPERAPPAPRARRRGPPAARCHRSLGGRVHLEHRRRAHAAAGAQGPDPDAAAAPA